MDNRMTYIMSRLRRVAVEQLGTSSSQLTRESTVAMLYIRI